MDLSISIHWFWIVPLVLLIAYLFSPRFRGDIAESRVRRILAAGLEKNRYTVFNDLVIPAGGGTVQIDHVVVSKFGVFVIESQYASGWVSGSEVQDRWKLQSLGRSRRLDNPMHRNRLQQEAVQALLGMPASKMRRVVVLTGQKGFKTRMPDNLVQPENLIGYLRKKAQQLLTDEQAARALKLLEEKRLRRSGKPIDRWGLLRLFLVLVLAGGAWLAFRDDIRGMWAELAERQEQAESPQLFHPDGARKTEREVWEDSLICASSADTGRCSCYDPDGTRVDMPGEQCRALAERGSVLNQ